MTEQRGPLMVDGMTEAALEAMIARVARCAVDEAMRDIGLTGTTVATDVTELRGLLASWRETKRTMWNTVVKLMTAAILTFIVAAVWVKTGQDLAK